MAIYHHDHLEILRVVRRTVSVTESSSMKRPLNEISRLVSLGNSCHKSYEDQVPTKPHEENRIPPLVL